MQKQQIHQEVHWVLWLTAFYIIGWAISAYLLPATKGILGFPLWFEVACLYIPTLFIILITIVIKRYFKEIPLEENNE